MTIAERQAREAHDRENPWRPMSTAPRDGTICELLFNDMAGEFSGDGQRFFQDSYGDWWRIDPPREVNLRPAPINWRPAHVRLTPERMAYLKKAAKRSIGDPDYS